MAAFELTASQSAAVRARGDSVLVSAGAGSGKTRVLVERLMSYLTDERDPKDIGSFLVITFTRAAAAELKGRILDELSRRRAERPADRRLRRQATLCAGAQIGTIHSFCMGLLREHGHLLGITPDFKVPDEDRAGQLKAAALEKLLEERYARIVEDDAFRALVDTVGAGLDDARLAGLVLSLHAKLQSQPYPEAWIRGQQNAFDLPEGRAAEDTVWGAYQLETLRQLLDYWAEELEALAALLAADPVGNYLDSVSATFEAVRGLRRAVDRGWDAALSCLPLPFPRLYTPKGMGDGDTAVLVKRRREACKKALDALASVLFAPSQALAADLRRVSPAMGALLRLTLDFDAAYALEKRRLGLLDFSDLEHFAAKLLIDEETGARTWLACELSQRYTEILVDEYQDVSKIQDLIFHALSRQDKNLFFVGDVKQSIYRFRLADPGLFLEKLKRFSDLPPEGDAARLEAPTRIFLRENFRSRPEILTAANQVFEALMSEKLGDVDYRAGHALIPGAAYPAVKGPCCALYTLALPDCGGDGERPDRLEFEARFAAEKIREMLDGGAFVTENGALRAAEPGDIAILLRSPSGGAGTFRAELSKLGIPVESTQGGGFFASTEILALTSLLAVVDNPRQDVPLIAALRSPLFDFTPDELSAVRASDRDQDFYGALCALGPGGDGKRAAFLEVLATLRPLGAELPVSELLAQAYEVTGAEAIFAAMPGGVARLRNLEALLDLARSFESAGWRGLFAFNAWLKRLAERGEEPASGLSPGAENAVRILSIHKSKGLEFPIVFLCDTVRKFNKADLRAPVLVHPELGLGPRVTDVRRGLEYPTLAFRAVEAKLNAEFLSEELRLLYVAMTRAREKLVVTCALKDPAEAVDRLRAALPEPLSPVALAGVQSPAQWLLRAVEEGAWTVDSGQLTVDSGQLTADSQGQEQNQEQNRVSPLAGVSEAELEARLTYVYPHMGDVSLPSKLTVTELKGRTMDPEPRADAAEEVAPKRAGAFRRPDFLRAARPLTGAEKGVATHLVMQHLNLEKTASIPDIQSEIARLHALGFLDRRQAEAADASRIFRFFQTDLGREMLDADELLREFRFSLLRPAAAFFPGAGEGRILLQGIVDCCIIKDGELTVLDFKTDFVTPETFDAVARSYFPQLETYVSAMEEITGKKVRRAALYFFSGGRTAEL